MPDETAPDTIPRAPDSFTISEAGGETTFQYQPAIYPFNAGVGFIPMLLVWTFLGSCAVLPSDAASISITGWVLGWLVIFGCCYAAVMGLMNLTRRVPGSLSMSASGLRIDGVFFPREAVETFSIQYPEGEEPPGAWRSYSPDDPPSHIPVEQRRRVQYVVGPAVPVLMHATMVTASGALRSSHHSALARGRAIKGRYQGKVWVSFRPGHHPERIQLGPGFTGPTASALIDALSDRWMALATPIAPGPIGDEGQDPSGRRS